MGHKGVEGTTRYLHVSPKRLQVLIDGATETVDDHRRNEQRHEGVEIFTPKKTERLVTTGRAHAYGLELIVPGGYHE